MCCGMRKPTSESSLWGTGAWGVCVEGTWGQCKGCRSERRNKGVSLKQALAAPDVKSAIVRASKLVALCKQMSALRKSDKPKKGVKKTPSS
jgi:hypothetical protein